MYTIIIKGTILFLYNNSKFSKISKLRSPIIMLCVEEPNLKSSAFEQKGDFMKYLNYLVILLLLFFVLFSPVKVTADSSVSENWHNSLCLRFYCSNTYFEDFSSSDINYTSNDPYGEEGEEEWEDEQEEVEVKAEPETLESQIDRANKEARIIRSTTITGGVMGVLPTLVFGSSLGVQPSGFFFGAVGGGIVGSLSGNLFARAMIQGEDHNAVKGFLGGIALGMLAGAVSGATAGGLMLIGTESDSDDFFGGPGLGMLGGAIIGAVVGGITGGIAGAAINVSLNTTETGLIDFRNCEINLSTPSINIHSDPFGQKEISYGVELIKFKF
jgi:hypothetical protein